MQTRLIVAAFSVCMAYAQTPNLSGVWQADLQKSQFAGPPPSQYLMIIEQQGPTFTERTGAFTRRGEQRSSLTFTTDGKPSIRNYRGLPSRMEANWTSGALVLEAKIAGTRPATLTEKYTLSPDGKILTVETASNMNGPNMEQTLVLTKQPDTAGEPLRKPEQTAGERFKNVKLMKDVPASALLDSMRYFSMSLGVECEHCHVRDHFDSDDKKEKITARKMMTMTHAANEQAFDGKMEVRCYTCHRGDKEPLNIPAL